MEHSQNYDFFQDKLSLLYFQSSLDNQLFEQNNILRAGGVICSKVMFERGGDEKERQN